MRILQWNAYYKVWDDADGDDFFCKVQEVTHWMPLPPWPNVQSEPRGSDRVGSTGGSAAATSESKWRIRISDCYCEYEYELIARVDDVCIHDLYELVRERLKADDVHGSCVDTEEHPSAQRRG